MNAGSLIVVGTGIQFKSHITPAAQAWIDKADKVLFIVDNPATAEWLRERNATAETLRFQPDKEEKLRVEMYGEMVERILAHVRQGLTVCAVFYGHPGIFVCPAHDAIKQARLEGFEAKMLPGISSLDCLYADLCIDPALNGCQSFDATDFLIHQRKFDPASDLILLQIGMIGDPNYESYETYGLAVLVEVLAEYYGPDHEVVVYEAAIYPDCEPVIQQIPLTKLAGARTTRFSTLYVPPKVSASVNIDMLLRLTQARNPS
jgi:uncharacterized protein YabN with tetrapyrrole methylase and pyrophosphatase domain